MVLLSCIADDAPELIEEELQDTVSVVPNLRVMTYNIHLANPPSAGEKRDLPAIASVINGADPDLVALQEVDVYTERSGIDIHQAKELGRLTNMTAFYVKAMDVFNGGWYGLAILSKFPIVDSIGYHLPPDPAVGGEMRELAVVTVQMPDGPIIVFAGTHLDHKSEKNRLYQADRLRKILQKETAPVILAGDFNAVPGSLTLDYFDTYFLRTCTHNCSPTFPAHNPKSAIDFIMYENSNEISIVSHKTIFEDYPSDHFPVVAELKIN